LSSLFISSTSSIFSKNKCFNPQNVIAGDHGLDFATFLHSDPASVVSVVMVSVALTMATVVSEMVSVVVVVEMAAEVLEMLNVSLETAPVVFVVATFLLTMENAVEVTAHVSLEMGNVATLAMVIVSLVMAIAELLIAATFSQHFFFYFPAKSPNLTKMIDSLERRVFVLQAAIALKHVGFSRVANVTDWNWRMTMKLIFSAWVFLKSLSLRKMTSCLCFSWMQAADSSEKIYHFQMTTIFLRLSVHDLEQIIFPGMAGRCQTKTAHVLLHLLAFLEIFHHYWKRTTLSTFGWLSAVLPVMEAHVLRTEIDRCPSPTNSRDASSSGVLETAHSSYDADCLYVYPPPLPNQMILTRCSCSKCCHLGPDLDRNRSRL